MLDPPAIGRGRRSWRWWTIRVVPGMVALTVGADALSGRWSELSGATAVLGHLRPGVVVVAVLAELASLGAYVALQRRLLASGGQAIGLRPLAAVTLAGNAIQNSLPAGPAWAALFGFRQYRILGTDPVLAGWTAVVASLVSDAGLAIVALVGLALAESQAAALDVVVAIVAAGLVVLVVAGGLLGLSNSGRGRVIATGLLRFGRRVFRRPEGDAGATIARALDRLGVVHPTRRDWAAALGFAVGNWGFDCACLGLAFVAVRADVPWRGLLLSYGAAQLAANLPLTPGGLGVVEGSLSIALVFYGGARESTVAAVLLYRMISFWALLPIGWLSWLGLRWSRRGRAASVEAPEQAFVGR